MTIQGETMHFIVAKKRYVCVFCLAQLERHNFGLVCTQNKSHYGYITKAESETISQEERYVKIGEMFPSEYLRGIDIGRPMKVTIKNVLQEMARNNSTNKVEPEYVMYFKETPKKLRLNVTMAKEVVKLLNEDDTDRWKNKPVTVYRTTIKAFGTEHVVPRIREVKPGDQFPASDEPRFKKVDDLLHALFENYGIPETVAKKALKDAGHKGFKASKSDEMYRDVEMAVLNGDLVIPEDTPIEDLTDGQPALIEAEPETPNHYAVED